MTTALASLTAPAYTPFLQPLPAWDQWYVWLVPLCLAVSIVYKSIRVRSMRHVPAEALKATGWILFGLAAAAAVLAILVTVLERET